MATCADVIEVFYGMAGRFKVVLGRYKQRVLQLVCGAPVLGRI
ncbi:hypothetical protein [uncultured Campylobacter sp.]|nr:hypothetical protein [uncultured Campylobacter sp.]